MIAPALRYKRNDQRPDERREWVVSGGYRHFFSRAGAALHVDYRYFDDSWGVRSHTVDLAWHQNLGSSTQVIPYLRYYSQSEADFFANQVDFGARYYADDYRLSAFGALSAGLRLRQEIGDWAVSLNAERYRADSGWGFFDGDESPALVEYWRAGIGLDYRFR